MDSTFLSRALTELSHNDVLGVEAYRCWRLGGPESSPAKKADQAMRKAQGLAERRGRQQVIAREFALSEVG
jgi:hypothetical protein